jgi:uncharacterized membrane protein YphA (DoxX/SURF4 family)
MGASGRPERASKSQGEKMERLYLRFPSGGLGFGLLLLRLTVAIWFFETGIPLVGTSPSASLFGLLLMSAALFLIAGIATFPITLVGAGCSIILLLLESEPYSWFPMLSIAVLSGSLALLGPGRYSLDARRANH